MSAGLTNLMNCDNHEMAAVLTSLSVSERKPMYYDTSFDWVNSSPKLSAMWTIFSAIKYLSLQDFSSPNFLMQGIR